MDERQPKPPPPPPPPPLEESMRELTLEDNRLDLSPPSRSPESMMMDIDAGGGGAADSRRQHGNVVPLQQRPSSNTLPAGAVGHGHGEMLQVNTPPGRRAAARGVEDILLEMLPQGSVLLAYTHNGYLFA